jgi:hypothetical protein
MQQQTGMAKDGDGKPPNGLRFTRAAPIDRDVVRAHLDTKIPPILSTRSGVGCKRWLAGRLSLASYTYT